MLSSGRVGLTQKRGRRPFARLVRLLPMIKVFAAAKLNKILTAKNVFRRPVPSENICAYFNIFLITPITLREIARVT
ncbi:MAG: hypothetical protein KAY66_03775, partial [Neisseria sp.]|nr:hypothetical protein [Neisseria sp.]